MVLCIPEFIEDLRRSSMKEAWMEFFALREGLDFAEPMLRREAAVAESPLQGFR